LAAGRRSPETLPRVCELLSAVCTPEASNAAYVNGLAVAALAVLFTEAFMWGCRYVAGLCTSSVMVFSWGHVNLEVSEPRCRRCSHTRLTGVAVCEIGRAVQAKCVLLGACCPPRQTFLLGGSRLGGSRHESGACCPLRHATFFCGSRHESGWGWFRVPELGLRELLSRCDVSC